MNRAIETCGRAEIANGRGYAPLVLNLEDFFAGVLLMAKTPRKPDRDRENDGTTKSSTGGASQSDRASGPDKGRTIRPDTPKVESNVGGDQAGVAGGGIDSKVSGRGGGA
jgi:hypothetical protein